MTDLLADFTHPGPAFRGKPFWSWNGHLDEAELLRQMAVFKDMGFGGFFMHARTGLVTEYLGQEWFRLTNACADAAERLGLEAWLYDEDRWPSGTAGGLVTADPRHRQQFVGLRLVPPADFAWDDGVLAAFTADVDGLAFSGVRRLSPGDAPDDRTVLVFRVEPSEPSSFYNGHTYVDTMSRAATDAYLSVTHDRYRERCGDRLGRSVRGIFTDEPHRGPVLCGFSITNANRLWMTPWTATLPAEFRAAFGYDLVDRLPELFLQADGRAVSPVKWQYMELTQRLFLRNFARPLYDWCDRHGLQLTGHALHEDTLVAQAAMQGSLMRFYEHLHLPGIDVLAEGNRNYWLAKQLQSAARQLGKPWLLSELYGCTGWQMTFEDHKAVGDWQALFGVNVRCHHLAWYTMAGEAKRDYPASIGHQSAWHADYRHVEDYFARLGVFGSAGRPCCDLLVLNPVESVWCQIHGGWAEGLAATGDAVRQLDRDYADLFHWLTAAQIDFDYGDEEMMSRLARVDRDAAGRPVLRFDRAAYRAVVVGGMTTIRGTTVALLRAFAAAGGAVIFAGEPPPYVDALPSDAATTLAGRATRVPWTAAAVTAAAAAPAEDRVEAVDASGAAVPHVLCQLRRGDDGRRYLMAISTDRDRPTDGVRLRIGGTGRVAEWDCETGQRYAVEARAAAGRVEFVADFPPAGSRTYVIGPGADAGLPARPRYRDVARHPAAGPFAFELTEPNVAVLDVARHRIDDGPWHPPADVLRIDRSVRTAFGLPWRSGEMVQPWFRDKVQPDAVVRGRVRLSFAFELAAVPAGPVDLAMERPDRFAVGLNGVAVDLPPHTGWWVDHAFRRVPLPAAALRLGANELTLDVDFHDRVDLEAVYLLGPFGVTVGPGRVTLGRLPDRLAAADVAAQGLPFYGGGIRYRVPVPAGLGSDRFLLDLPAVEAACANVSAPGRPPQMMAWRPYRADVTDLIADGPPEVVVDVTLTRRNTFGPLHQLPPRAPHYGPDSFTTAGEHWSDDPVLFPAGLLAPPVFVEAELAAPVAHPPAPRRGRPEPVISAVERTRH